MEYTSNYQLPVWAETDRILRTDFNDAFDTIETAMSGFGNCRVASGSYVGTGGSSPTLHFPGTPLVVIIRAVDVTPDFCVMMGGCSRFHTETALTTTERGVVHTQCTVTWGENSATWLLTYYGTDVARMNAASRTYRYAALLDAEDE